MSGRQRSGSRDVFPATRHTWIEERLSGGEGGLADVRRHVMDVYRWPLTVYVRGSSFKTLGDPEELVVGFFASRLARDHYLHDWLNSGRPLRKWLMTGLRHFLFETAKSESRERSLGVRLDAKDIADSDEEASNRNYDRAVARTLVSEVVRQTEIELIADGLELHWRVFHLHVLLDQPYSTIQESLGLPPARLSALCRTATRRFRTLLAHLAAWPGASEEEIQEELEKLKQHAGQL
jgi:DNA-directed RNA polymerase specialized sigma24 family protein